MNIELTNADRDFLKDLLRSASWEGSRIPRLTVQQAQQAERILEQLEFVQPSPDRSDADPNGVSRYV